MNNEPALLWVDIETTGLIPREGQILELGLRLTDSRLTTLAEASWVVRFDRAELSNLSDFILEMHMKNGLLFECMKSDMYLADVEDAAVRWAFSRIKVGADLPPMAGSTVGFDRSWLKEHMIAVDQLAHYRSFDVSTIKLAARLWMPEAPLFKGRDTHRVMPDIEDSVQELQYYIYSHVVRGWPYSDVKIRSPFFDAAGGPDTARVGPSDA
jgi:oligoribonuclease